MSDFLILVLMNQIIEI